MTFQNSTLTSQEIKDVKLGDVVVLSSESLYTCAEDSEPVYLVQKVTGVNLAYGEIMLAVCISQDTETQFRVCK